MSCLISEIAERWKSLTDQEKEPYKSKEKVDKERYMKEKEVYIKEGGAKKGGKRATSKAKDGPKRSKSPFFIFQDERRESLKKENPKLSHTEIVSVSPFTLETG